MIALKGLEGIVRTNLTIVWVPLLAGAGHVVGSTAHDLTVIMQGSCTKEKCPYLHKKVDPAAPVCRAFVEGLCLRGAFCLQKHLSARMVKELRASHSLVTASQVSQHIPIVACHSLAG